jgi:hypothetical protein
MSLRGSRRLTLVAVLLLVLPLLVSALAIALPAHVHECAFDKECLTCRWTTAAVTELPSPTAAVAPPRPGGVARPAWLAQPRAGVSSTAASRGPPSVP